MPSKYPAQTRQKMDPTRHRFSIFHSCIALAVVAFLAAAFNSNAAETNSFPLPVSAYGVQTGQPLTEILSNRIAREPFNLVATIIFLLAIIHTFMTSFFQRKAHAVEEHGRTLMAGKDEATARRIAAGVKLKSQVLHFLGEVEAVFGIWVIPLMVAWSFLKGWPSAENYINSKVDFTEPLFVVVIMAMAAGHPILQLSEKAMAFVARLGGGSIAAWWFSVLTLGPLLGSCITEPAAMTLSALLLSRKFYTFSPSARLAYATLGVLFVNVSIGGTLTHFAAPPVLMVAGKWGWNTPFMFEHFGWKALSSILICNSLLLLLFRKEFKKMNAKFQNTKEERKVEAIPIWVTLTSMGFMLWTVVNSHHPVLFIAGFLFYLAYTEATEPHQRKMHLRPALLVGFFLAGLVIHGGLQNWWLEPILGSLGRSPLFVGATLLTAFNDNAAITYLASLVPEFTEPLKHAVMAGAVTGGGLTVIANAPNPAGQSILSKHFPNGVSPLWLFLAALGPTIIAGLCFWFL